MQDKEAELEGWKLTAAEAQKQEAEYRNAWGDCQDDLSKSNSEC